MRVAAFLAELASLERTRVVVMGDTAAVASGLRVVMVMVVAQGTAAVRPHGAGLEHARGVEVRISRGVRGSRVAAMLVPVPVAVAVRGRYMSPDIADVVGARGVVVAL